MQVSYRYRHLPGLYRTCRIPFANTGLVLFQYLHADTYNLQANVFRPGTFWIPAHQYIHTLPVNIFWPDTVFANGILVPTSYRQISSGPVPFCPQHTDTNIVPANIFWPSTILPLAYWYRHLTGKYLLAQYHFAISVPVPALDRQISSGPVPFCP